MTKIFAQIDFEGGVDPEDPLIDMVGHQAVEYNHFNSASLIHDLTSDYKIELYYGPDDQRRMAVYKEGDDEVKTRYYVGAYEKQIDHQNQNNEIRVHYISALGQLVAIYVEDDSEQVTDEGLNGKMYYPHQDHLGSIIHITDANGDIVYTQSFDAWGRTRNPDDHTYTDIPERPDWLWRGYTGHEHLDEFGLINMNGRLYDPVVGRMLSADNFVPTPDFSQGYNRYSYVLNNPLKYTDPDGEHPVLVAMAIGAGIGALQGGIRAANDPNVSIAGGIFRGALVGAVGGALSTVGGGPFIANVAWGAAQGALTGGLDAALWGNDVGRGMLYGAASGAVFAAATSGIEAINNASQGHGFRTNEGVWRHYSRERNVEKLSSFVNERHGIDADLMYSEELNRFNEAFPNYAREGEATIWRNEIALSELAFQDLNTLKQTIVHEWGHLKVDFAYDLVINPISGEVLSETREFIGTPMFNNDGPNGWLNEVRNIGALKIDHSAILPVQWKNYYSQGGSFWHTIPSRYNYKVNISNFR